MILIKSFRRLLTFVVCLSLCIGSVVFPVSASDVTEIIFGEVYATCGEEVSVPVFIKNNPGLAGFRFRIEYDAEVLELISVEKGDILDVGTMTSVVNDNKETLTFLWYSTVNVEADGNIAILKFKVSENVNPEIPLCITYLKEDIIDQNKNPIECIVTDGKIILGYTLSVIVDDYKIQSGPATVKIISKDEVLFETTTVEGVAVFDLVQSGEYIVEISKYKYTTEKHVIVVNNNVELVSSIYLVADINRDGKINAIDKVNMTLYIKNSEFSIYADLNGDGKVNARDKIVVTKIIRGIYNYE